MQARKLAKRLGGVLALLALLTGVYVGWNWKAVAAWRAAKQVQSSATAEEKLAAARKLLSAGEPAYGHMAALSRRDDPATSQAIVEAIRERITDPQFSSLMAGLLNSGLSNDVILELFFDLQKLNDTRLKECCLKSIRESLSSPNSSDVLRAIPLAIRSDVNLRAEIVPAMRHESAEVRRSAMVAIGPISGPDALIADEDLFVWLHDFDLQVRLLCEVALTSRGLDSTQIDAARKLTHEDVGERLSLLNDLQRNSESITDPGPWLERLSRDPNPAVRAGAARVACERKLRFANWVRQLANADPDPLVRQIAGFHHSQMDVQPVTFP